MSILRKVSVVIACEMQNEEVGGSFQRRRENENVCIPVALEHIAGKSLTLLILVRFRCRLRLDPFWNYFLQVRKVTAH